MVLGNCRQSHHAYVVFLQVVTSETIPVVLKGMLPDEFGQLQQKTVFSFQGKLFTEYQSSPVPKTLEQLQKVLKQVHSIANWQPASNALIMALLSNCPLHQAAVQVFMHASMEMTMQPCMKSTCKCPHACM